VFGKRDRKLSVGGRMTEKPYNLTISNPLPFAEATHHVGRGVTKECHDSKAVPYVEAPATRYNP
jgi:hypothetical protein